MRFKKKGRRSFGKKRSFNRKGKKGMKTKNSYYAARGGIRL